MWSEQACGLPEMTCRWHYSHWYDQALLVSNSLDLSVGTFYVVFSECLDSLQVNPEFKDKTTDPKREVSLPGRHKPHKRLRIHFKKQIAFRFRSQVSETVSVGCQPELCWRQLFFCWTFISSFFPFFCYATPQSCLPLKVLVTHTHAQTS